jgi:hypothetical protein
MNHLISAQCVCIVTFSPYNPLQMQFVKSFAICVDHSRVPVCVPQHTSLFRYWPGWNFRWKPHIEWERGGVLCFTKYSKVNNCTQTTRKSVLEDGCCGAVQGEYLLPAGLESCYWCEVGNTTPETYTSTQIENIKQLRVACSECNFTVFCVGCDNIIDWITSVLTTSSVRKHIKVSLLCLFTRCGTNACRMSSAKSSLLHIAYWNRNRDFLVVYGLYIK